MNPKFTIIIPSYKGGEYLKQCVQSVLAQTYRDFELVVLDNCSEDGSAEWLAGLGDSRIKVYTSATVLPIEANWARVLEIPKNEFITLLGHDDLLHPNYLEVMNALILAHPDAGLYQAHFHLIDGDGQIMHQCSPQPARETAAEYLTARLTRQRESFGTGYMMRSERYHTVGGIPGFEKLMFADDALWIKLMHNSWKATSPEVCFSYRVNAGSTSAVAQWSTHIKAMRQYIAFLQDFAQRDDAVAQALKKDGPEFFLSYCRHMYLLALVEATKKNERVKPEVIETIAATLALIDPQLIGDIRQTKTIRLREMLNQNPVARLAYNAFIWARHGEWRGRKAR